MSLLQGFPAVLGKKPRLIILGSMPSVQSLQEHQYYANPRNLFWPFMADIFGFDPALDYAQRCQYVASQHVAIWDVVATCRRRGSLDSNIEKESLVANDFVTLFADQPQLKSVLFNGQAAAKIFKTNVLPKLLKANLVIDSQVLPSTSPANASQKREHKFLRWQATVKTILCAPAE